MVTRSSTSGTHRTGVNGQSNGQDPHRVEAVQFAKLDVLDDADLTPAGLSTQGFLAMTDRMTGIG
jgi:hypothetical protein